MGIFDKGIAGLGLRGLIGKEPNPNVQFPGASPEELELMRNQNQFLSRQMKAFDASQQEADLLRPFLLKQAGLEEIRDASGKLTGYKRGAGLEQQDLLETKLRDRSLAALEGNLPVDPKLERNLKEGRINLGEQLRKQLGSGYETSTPGVEALANYDQRKEELLFGARTGMLNTSEALAGAREGRSFQDIAAIGGAGQFALPFLSAGTTLSQAFNSPLTRSLQERGLGLEANKATRAFDFQNYATRYDHWKTLDTNASKFFSNIFGGGMGG